MNTTLERLTITQSGHVGIGTANPQRTLEISGDVAGISLEGFVASPHAGAIRFGDNSGWKLHIGRSREAVGGALNSGTTGVVLSIQDNGHVGIGTTNPGAPLHVAQYMTVGPFAATTGQGGLDVVGPAAELGFVRRTLTAWPANPAAGDRFVWYNPNGTARL